MICTEQTRTKRCNLLARTRSAPSLTAASMVATMVPASPCRPASKRGSWLAVSRLALCTDFPHAPHALLNTRPCMHADRLRPTAKTILSAGCNLSGHRSARSGSLCFSLPAPLRPSPPEWLCAQLAPAPPAPSPWPSLLLLCAACRGRKHGIYAPLLSCHSPSQRNCAVAKLKSGSPWCMLLGAPLS